MRLGVSYHRINNKFGSRNLEMLISLQIFCTSYFCISFSFTISDFCYNCITVTGPMCRYACDLLPLLNVLAKPEMLPPLRLDEPVNLKKLKIYYMTDNAGGYFETPVHR